MNVGIVGLGLIGGSFAKAYKKAGHTVYACDKDKTILNFAQLCGTVDKQLNEETTPLCDLILIAVLPNDAIEYFKTNAHLMNADTVIIDCCGTKRTVCDKCFKIAKENGLTFVGGHPMAGTHKSGFKNSDEELFKDAPMVLVPPVFDNPELLERVEELLKPVGFGKFSVTTAQKHDEMIAFTSQMPHIISNAFIKSPVAKEHNGFSAGSYKDLTRVAWLNPDMWAELFMENSDNVLKELDTLINSLNEYKTAIVSGDTDTLVSILDDGRKCKERVDGNNIN
ncbi:MAG: prephenate dehydrogenase/arogenate dehydrogenase family protein [Clostridia bacterium]|nr:prephenate dehydrogenase/arogenate dehydrogenase family protein [Clostridia bacterium]